MTRRWQVTLAAMLIALLGCCAQAVSAGQRTALVMGVARYERVPELRNSANDARDMARALRGIGFQVTEVIDPDQRGMLDAVSGFLNRSADADVALFYYSGHGIQLGERNYLVPRDAGFESQTDVPLRAVDLGVILDGLEARARVRVVLLDACRDNPFAALFRARGLSRGLGPVSAALGTLVGFATAPGAVAADGDGRNSPFAKALLQYVATPGLDVLQMMRLVRADVVAATAGRQIPWDHSSLTGEVALNPATAVAAAPAAPPVAAPARTDTPPAATVAALSSAAADVTAPARRGTGLTLDQAFEQFRAKPGAKAFAESGEGGWGFAFGRKKGKDAVEAAVHSCNFATGRPCRLTALNGTKLSGKPAQAASDRLASLAGRRLAGPFADETKDFKVASTAELHQPYHEKTPVDVPGAATVTTADLVRLLAERPEPLLIDARLGDGRDGTIPGAVWLKGAGTVAGNERLQAIETLFARMLANLAPSKDRPLVLFCTGPDCWLSRNAALRAVRLGYTRVLWYRGGFAAWKAAGLPVAKAELVGSLEP